jgi:hypothetical protein
VHGSGIGRSFSLPCGTRTGIASSGKDVRFRRTMQFTTISGGVGKKRANFERDAISCRQERRLFVQPHGKWTIIL